MTSPLSLLAPLAAGDPPAGQPDATDPAAFAAALLVAAQQLARPVRAAADAPAPPPAESAGDGDQSAGAGEGSSGGTAEGAAPELAAPPVSTAGTQVCGSSGAARLAAAAGAAPAAGTAGPGAESPPSGPQPDAAEQGGATHGKDSASGPIRLDVVSAEPARPRRPARDVALELTRLALGRPAAPDDRAAAAAPLQEAPPDAASAPEAAAGLATAGSETPVPAAGKAGRSAAALSRRDRREKVAETAVAQPGNLPQPQAPSLLPAPAGTAAARAPSVEREGRERGAGRQLDTAPEMPGSDAAVADPAGRALVENARLGRQLAEVLGGLDVTGLEVRLAPGSRGRASPVAAQADGTLASSADRGDPAPAPRVFPSPVPLIGELREASTPAAYRATDSTAGLGGPTGAAAPAGTDTALTPSVQSVPRPEASALSTPALPGLADAARSLLGRIADRFDTSRTRPADTAPPGSEPAVTAAVGTVTARRPQAPVAPAAMAAAAMPLPTPAATVPADAAPPTLPADRQDLPGDAAARPLVAEPAPSRARPGEDRSSDSVAASSSGGMGQGERLTAREGGSFTRAPGEARNLPHDGTSAERPAGLADRVSLQVADADGRQTRIRVAVLGDQVRAVIVPPDPESARQLERRMDELQDALVRQGFSSARVSVQQAGEAAIERGGGAGLPVSTPTDTRAAASPGRDQPAGDQRQGRGQRDPRSGDGQRHPQGQRRHPDPDERRR